MTQLKDDTVHTLRRRAQDLRAEGYNEQYVRVLERAAEELSIHKRFIVSGERFTLEAVMANRVLRNALAATYAIIREYKGKHHPGLAEIRGCLNATKEPGLGRHIIMVEVTKEKTREGLEEELRVLFDSYFKDERAGQLSDSFGGTDGTEKKEGSDSHDAGDTRGPSRARGARQQAARRVP